MFFICPYCKAMLSNKKRFLKVFDVYNCKCPKSYYDYNWALDTSIVNPKSTIGYWMRVVFIDGKETYVEEVPNVENFMYR